MRTKLAIPIEKLWIWLHENGFLPSNLPEDWDPIHGDGGVFSHGRDTGHALSPIPVATSRTAGKGPNDVVEPRRVVPREEACRVCGINYVLHRCWLATRDRNVGHVEAYLNVVSETINRLHNAKEKLRDATTGFVAEHTSRMSAQHRDQDALLEGLDDRHRARTRRMLRRQQVTLLRDALAPVKALCSKKRIDRPLEEISDGLASLQSYLAGMARNDAGKSRRLSGSGNQTELVTEFVKTLYDYGFEYAQIDSDLIRLTTLKSQRPGNLGRDRVRRRGAKKKEQTSPTRTKKNRR